MPSSIRPGIAVGLALLAVVLFVVTTQWFSGFSFLGILPFNETPEQLSERARQLLLTLGYTEPVYQVPVDRAWGFGIQRETIEEIEKSDDSADRWEKLRGRPDAGSFWYRQSPAPFRPLPASSIWFAGGAASPGNPPFAIPGEVAVDFSLDGRVKRLVVKPRLFSTQPQAVEVVDWTSLFVSAGLEPMDFALTDPGYQSFVAPGRRIAWVGSSTRYPGVDLRVEAGEFEGRPVYFEVVPRQDVELLREEPSRSPWLIREALLFYLGYGLVIILLVVLILLARRNLASDRGDRVGATQLGLFTGSLVFIVGIAGSHSLFRLSGLDAIFPILATSLFYGCGAWLLYLTLEPYGREVWPSLFEPLHRILHREETGWRHATVGLSVLIGLVTGIILFTVVNPLQFVIEGMTPGAPARPYWPDLTVLSGTGGVFAGVAWGVMKSILLGMAFVVTLVGSRYLTRNPAVSIVVTVLMWTVFGALSYPGSIFWSFALSVLSVAILMRYGILAFIVAALVNYLGLLAVASNLMHWTAQAKWFAVGIVTLLAVYGVWAATAGQWRRESEKKQA
jgi:hypothetical protein